MKLASKIKLGIVIFLTGLVFFSSVKAATIELSLEKEIVSSKEDVVVLVTINSEGKDINTAQAVISFPNNLLSVIDISHTDSIFSFWLEGPNYDNDKGQIRFVGGSTSGLSGTSLKVMRVAFKVKGSGLGRLGINDGIINASDGSGSNVYSTARGLDINIPTTAEFQAVSVERIKTEATIAKELPGQLGLSVPFYPDSSKWNNRSASFQVKWNITPDTIASAIAINKNPVFVPEADFSALPGNKIFAALSDGVWYLHLRVANNIGWSPTLHYRIAVDATPPAEFKIILEPSSIVSDPTPVINFFSSDVTSGIRDYTISLDGSISTTTNQNKYKFPALLPGSHHIVVVATDKAGNSISEEKKLEIISIASPVITYANRRINIDDGTISAGGTAKAGVEIIVQIINSKKQKIFEQVVPIDNNRNWNIAIAKSLNSGNYNLLATARDENLASSIPVVSEVIKVEKKPMLVIGSFELTDVGFYIGLIVILLFGFSVGWFSYRQWRTQLGRRVTIAERDVLNVITNLEKDVKKLGHSYVDSDLNPTELTEIKYILKNMEENLEKSRRYVVGNIEEIDK